MGIFHGACARADNTIPLAAPEGWENKSSIKIIEFPRESLDKFLPRSEAKCRGIYFLFGLQKAYIGRAEKLGERLEQHYSNPAEHNCTLLLGEFWEKTVVAFPEPQKALTWPQIEALEWLAIKEAREVSKKTGRYELTNQVEGKTPHPSVDEKKVQESFSSLKNELKRLGYNLF